MPSKKKKYNARFPPARIKKIMQTDEEVGKVAAAVPVIISRALELFVESLMKKASVITTARLARTLTTFHLKQCILSETKFDFLQELVESIPDRPDQSFDDEPMAEGPIPPSDKPKKKRGRKPKSEKQANAGPSNSADSESEDNCEEDEDDDNSGSSEEAEKINEENEVENIGDNTNSHDSNEEQIEAEESNENNAAVASMSNQILSGGGGMSEDDDYDT